MTGPRPVRIDNFGTITVRRWRDGRGRWCAHVDYAGHVTARTERARERRVARLVKYRQRAILNRDLQAAAQTEKIRP